MRATEILYPLDSDIPLHEMKQHKENCKTIQKQLNDLKEGELVKAVGDKDLHPDFNENYDLSDDVGIPSTVSSSEPLILNEMQDQEYRQLIQTLNKKQKEFFYHILHLIKTSDKPFYYFLSGGSWSGQVLSYQSSISSSSKT